MWAPGDLMIRLRQVEAAAGLRPAFGFIRPDTPMTITWWKRCRIVQRTLCLFLVPARTLPARRPSLVQCFERFGLLPDYDCDLMELDPRAVCLRHVPSAGGGELTPKVETAFARLNRVLGDLKQSLQIRDSELEGGAPPYRRTGGKIAQTQRIPARVEIAERAEANSAEIARTPGGPDIARAISSSGKTGENGLEKAAPTRTRTSTFRRLKRISGMVRAASRDCAGPGTNATRIACVCFEAAD